MYIFKSFRHFIEFIFCAWNIKQSCWRPFKTDCKRMSTTPASHSWCGQGCVGCECTGNSVPCQEWRWGGRASTHQWAITEPEFWPVQADGVYTTGLLHFDFDITKRNWSRIQLFHNNVKHNLTPICHQGCERDILFLTFNLNALM